MESIPQKFFLNANETWQFRRAQAVHESIAQAVRRVCESNEFVLACYLLDARKQKGDDLKLLIAVSVDDEATQMDNIAMQLQQVLLKFPEVARNVVIMSAKRFAEDYAGAEFYRRGGKTAKSLRIPLRRASQAKNTIVDVRLKSGVIFEHLIIDENEQILGRVVDGQNDVDKRPLPFAQEDIEAVRRRGWASRLGLAHWRMIKGQRRNETH